MVTRCYRLLFGLLGLSAVITELTVLAQRGTLQPANFFSYFTVQSNLLAAAVLLLLAAQPSGRWQVLRGAATLYMTMTGIIFSVLLASLDQVLTAVPWDNVVLHYIMPVAILLDWLLLTPRRAVSFHQSLLWLTYPVVYVAYSLVRGAFTGWYPYPFLNASLYGYGRIGLTLGVLTASVIALSQLLRKTALIRRHDQSNG